MGMMALAYVGPRGLLPARAPADYACVGVPPEWEASEEATRDGVFIAAVARILRGALAISRGAPRKPSRLDAERG